MYRIPKYEVVILKDKPEAASQVGIQDVNNNFTIKNVEQALKELADRILQLEAGTNP